MISRTETLFPPDLYHRVLPDLFTWCCRQYCHIYLPWYHLRDCLGANFFFSLAYSPTFPLSVHGVLRANLSHFLRFVHGVSRTNSTRFIRPVDKVFLIRGRMYEQLIKLKPDKSWSRFAKRRIGPVVGLRARLVSLLLNSWSLAFVFRSGKSIVLPTMRCKWHLKLDAGWTRFVAC